MSCLTNVNEGSLFGCWVPSWCSLCKWCFSSRSPFISSSFSSNQPKNLTRFERSGSLAVQSCRYHWQTTVSSCLVPPWRRLMDLYCFVVAVQGEFLTWFWWRRVYDLSSKLHHTRSLSLRYPVCLFSALLIEPPHGKSNKMTCAPSEDSDQPGHPPSLSAWRYFGSLATHWAQ